MSQSHPTDRQTSANRLNAQKSTGPRSARGKTKSSRNALKLGIFARDLLVPGEDPEQLRRHKNEMLKSLNPADAIQLALAERIVEADWKLKRLRAAEQSLYQGHVDAIQQQHEDALSQAKDALRDFRFLHRGKLEAGTDWARQNPSELETNQARLAKLERKLARAKSHLDQPPNPAEMTLDLLRDNPYQTPELEKIAKYQQQLTGTFNRCLNQFQRLKNQTEKREEELTELTRSQIEPSEQELETESSETKPIEAQEQLEQGDMEMADSETAEVRVSNSSFQDGLVSDDEISENAHGAAVGIS